MEKALSAFPRNCSGVQLGRALPKGSWVSLQALAQNFGEGEPICASVSPFVVNEYELVLCEPYMWFTDSLKINQQSTQLPKAKHGILFPVLVWNKVWPLGRRGMTFWSTKIKTHIHTVKKNPLFFLSNPTNSMITSGNRAKDTQA